MDNSGKTHRREFLRSLLVLSGGLVPSGCASVRQLVSHEASEVSPAEDLMREHGVLKRVLLVYGECIRRIDAKEDLDPANVADAAEIIRTFIENYHERLEEEFLFPRFRRANVHMQLVEILIAQHEAGRILTGAIQRLANARPLQDTSDRRMLADSIRQFILLYNPHEAREDTVLFPAFRKIVSAHEYDALGEEFEKREHQRFGSDGFEEMVNKVATIEKRLGLYDLDQFTPKV